MYGQLLDSMAAEEDESLDRQTPSLHLPHCLLPTPRQRSIRPTLHPPSFARFPREDHLQCLLSMPQQQSSSSSTLTHHACAASIGACDGLFASFTVQTIQCITEFFDDSPIFLAYLPYSAQARPPTRRHLQRGQWLEVDFLEEVFPPMRVHKYDECGK